MDENYICLKNNVIKIDDFSLSPIKPQHIENVRKWRNDQIKILRQKDKISKKQQFDYFEENIWPLFQHKNPKQILFAFFEKKKLIGYGGLVHIKWEDKNAEVSFLLSSEFILKDHIHDFYFNIYLKLIQKVGFDDLNFHKLHAEIFDTRTHHIEILKKNGFKIEAVLKEHVFIENQYVDSIICGKLRKEYLF